MPPKRRKLSAGTGVGGENNDDATSSCNTGDWLTVPETITHEPTGESSETGVANQGSLAFSPENKSKDDALKPTRISKRLINKRSRFADEEDPKDKEQAKPVRQATPRKPRSSASARHTKQAVDSTKNKGQKTYGSWSVVDKRMFFLGLQQYGKNFESISKKISQAAKMRGFVPKDKIQVQYFYYRVWRKIAKFVDMKGAEVPMKTQELYGLINYGVLSKHVKENDPLFGECLNNLIHNGETTFVRKESRRNKCGKLRTPVCACLKKINRIIDIHSSESSSSQKLPQTVSIELSPKNSKAWAKVQSVSQNPRIRIKVASNRTLDSIIKFLIKKWKPQRIKSKEKLGVAEETKENLVIFLHPNAKIFPVTLIAHQHKKIDVTFSNYRQKVLPLLQNEMLQNEKKSRSVKESDKTSGTEKEKDKNVNELNPDQSSKNMQAQEGILTCSDSSHSQKSEGKLSLFIPEYKEQNFASSPLLGMANALLDADICSFKGASSSGNHSSSAEDKLTNSPKGPRTPVVLLEDENAMFPDSTGPFSPTSLASSISSSLQQTKSPPEACLSPRIFTQPSMSPEVAAAGTSPSLGRKKRVGGRNTKKTSAATADTNLPLPYDPNNPSAPTASGENLSTSSTSPAKQQDCPGPPVAGPQPESQQGESLVEDSQKEIARLTRLATEEGFTALNSHTVTLLHLSLLLGRETLLRLQYEWRERRPLRGGGGVGTGSAGLGGVMHIPPLLGQAAGQMSNLLRRLCNLATLELTDFVRESEHKTSRTGSSAGCSRCATLPAATASSTSTTAVTVAKGSITRTRRQSLLNQTEREKERLQDECEIIDVKSVTKETASQTDPPPQLPFTFPALPPPGVRLSPNPGIPTTVHLQGNVQVLQQASVVTAGGRTFVAGPPTPTGAQVNGGDPVFRVPLIPTFRDAARVEQMKQEEQRRLQETAKTILEQGSNQRRLLKRRRVINKKRKEPPLIVQRTLMPKLESGGMVTYIQQPTIAPVSNAVLYSMSPAAEVAPQTFTSQLLPSNLNASPSVALVSQGEKISSTEAERQRSNDKVDILRKAVLSAEIDAKDSLEKLKPVSPIKDESDETKTLGPKPLSEEVTTITTGIDLTKSVAIDSSRANTDTVQQPSLHADISISEFDISLSGIPVSNMGPDAGDKFLDLVLQNSEQGFSGLLSTPKKTSSASTTLPLFAASETPASTSTYNPPAVLRTPTHFGTSTSVGLITPIKLDLDQEWGGSLASGDISLSSILGDSSSFRTNPAHKSPDTGSALSLSAQPGAYAEHTDTLSNDGFLKHAGAADLSFSSLLGDPSFKKDDDSTCDLSPPLSSATPSATQPSLVFSVSGTSSAASSAAQAARGKGPEDGTSSAPLFSEVSQDSFTTKLDVDGMLHGMMVSESSLDLVSKFEALTGGAAAGQSLASDQRDVTMVEEIVRGSSVGPLTVTCRESVVDSCLTKLESPSAS